MIEVYAFATPNSLKIPIALEELGLAYRLIPVNLRNGEQKSADFMAINANAKVPVVVDRNVPGKRARDAQRIRGHPPLSRGKDRSSPTYRSPAARARP